MVALTLGLFVAGGAASIYLANRNAFATVEGVARVEENARFAAELLARDIREAGNSVCGGATASTNLVSSLASPNWAAWDNGLMGNAMGNTDALALSVASPSGSTAQVMSPSTDSLLVWSASTGSSPVRITSHTLGVSGTFTTATAHGYKDGDLAVACDGKQLVTFKVQSPNVNTMGYSGGGALTKSIDPGGLISPLSIHLWYVGGSTDGAANALRRITLNENGAGSTANDEMITGVGGLQIKYLIGDVAGVPSQSASYQSAASVPAWGNVIAVQIALTLSSLDKINPAGPAPSVFTYTLPLTVGIRRRLQP